MMKNLKSKVFILVILICLPHYGYADKFGQSFMHRLQGLIGKNPVHCGTYQFDIDKQRYLSADDITKVSDCMTDAYHRGQAFYFSLAGPDFNSVMINGILGLPDKKAIYRYAYNSPACPGFLCNDAFSLSRCRVSEYTDYIHPKRACQLKLEAPFSASPLNNPVKQQSRCVLPKPIEQDDFTVLASSGRGGRELDAAIDDSGHVLTQVNVLVNYQHTPVVLLLSAYRPTIWNIRWTEGTRIFGVLAGGFYQQFITGLPDEIPVTTNCIQFHVDIEADLRVLNHQSRYLFGRPVKMIYPLPAKSVFPEIDDSALIGRVLIGDEPAQEAIILTSTDTTPESLLTEKTVPAGQTALDLAVQKGLIRKAIQEDVDAWVAMRIEKGVTPSKIILTDRYNYYVVLKPFELPVALPASSRFFIPKGVPKPTQKTQRKQVITMYDFNTGEMTDEVLLFFNE